MAKKQLYYQTILSAGLILISLTSSAQFTHAEVDLAYSLTTYESGDIGGEDATKNHQVKLQFKILHRPLIHFGFGLDIGVPVVNIFKYNFNGSKTIDGGEFYNGFSDRGIYSPSTNDYSIKNGVSKTLKTRIFPRIDGTFYFDIRYSFMNVKEEFVFKRGGVSPVNINFLRNHSAKGPGFALGLAYPFDNNFYFKYEFSMDFYKFKVDEDSFSYNIQYSNYGGSDVVIIHSRISEREINYLFNAGVGYIF